MCRSGPSMHVKHALGSLLPACFPNKAEAGYNAGTACSTASRWASQASQSDLVVLRFLVSRRVPQKRRSRGQDPRQQSHPVDLPYPQGQGDKLHQDVGQLDLEDLGAVGVGLEALKGLVGAEDAHDGVLEGHEDHHDAEDLQRVARHVHHDGGHGQALDGAQGHLPRLLDLEGVHLVGGRGGALGGGLAVLGVLPLRAGASANVHVPRMEWRGMDLGPDRTLDPDDDDCDEG